MRQRAVIAMAVANDPDLLIADEPTTALDVTVQAQILEVLQSLLRERRHRPGPDHPRSRRRRRPCRPRRGRLFRPRRRAGDVDGAVRRPAPSLHAACSPPAARCRRRAAGRDRGAAVPARPARLRFHPRCALAEARCRVERPTCASGRPGAPAIWRGRQGRIGGAQPMRRPQRADPVGAPAGEGVSGAPRGDLRSSGRACACRRRRLARPCRRRDARAGRQNRLRQVDAGRCIVRLLEPTPARSCCAARTSRSCPLQRCGRCAAISRSCFRIRTPRCIRACGSEASSPSRSAWPTWRARGRAVAELLDVVRLARSMPQAFRTSCPAASATRVGIARALALGPRSSSSTSRSRALDVSVQAGVLNLLEELQKRFGLAFLFIAHDLAVVRHISHRVAVMYLGRIVETPAPRISTPGDAPYSQALLSAIPLPTPSASGRAGASCSRAMCRARSIRRRAAASGRAAGRRPNAGPRCRIDLLDDRVVAGHHVVARARQPLDRIETLQHCRHAVDHRVGAPLVSWA